MKRTILFFLAQVFCFTAGFAQNSPWKEGGILIPTRADLDVHWEATNKFPRKVWTYQLLPNDFSPKIISNIITLCSFTEKDLKEHRLNGYDFQSADGSRKLSISFPSGDIHYETPEPRFSMTNLAVDVPEESQLPDLTRNVLRRLHINFSEITGWIDDHKMDFTDGEGRTYFVGKTVITDIKSRRVYFRRTVDGIPIAREFYGFNFGEHGKISKLSITWPRLQRIKSYRTVSKKDVINFLREGNARHGPTPVNAPDINWPTIKSVTITKAIPSYLIKNNRLYPYLALNATIDTGHGTAVVAILCPIIGEAKL